MTEDDWHAPDATAFAMLLSGRLAVLFNRGGEPVTFDIPAPAGGWSGEAMVPARSVAFLTESPKRG